MKCSVFIATSVDGYIATPDGSVDWLMSAGSSTVDMGEDVDMGFNAYMASIDCMIMGRKCMQMIDSMQLTPEQWPYSNIPIIVLSRTLKEVPKRLKGKVSIYSGDIETLISQLSNQGFQHAYIDGGTTIQSFIDLKLINEMTLTRAPILLGDGIPLFGNHNKHIKLKNCGAKSYANDFIQEYYQLSY
mgnify:CR=1 FL=1